MISNTVLVTSFIATCWPSTSRMWKPPTTHQHPPHEPIVYQCISNIETMHLPDLTLANRRRLTVIDQKPRGVASLDTTATSGVSSLSGGHVLERILPPGVLVLTFRNGDHNARRRYEPNAGAWPGWSMDARSSCSMEQGWDV